MPLTDRFSGAVTLLQAFLADDSSGGGLPPLHLPMMPVEASDIGRKSVRDRLRADQRRRDADARRAGRDPLAEAISAHLAACARTGQRPLIATW